MSTKIKTALSITGAVMTAVSTAGIAVTLARQADPADPAPVATAPDLRDGAEVQAEEAIEAETELPYGEAASWGDLTLTVEDARMGEVFTSGDAEYRDVHAVIRWENHGDRPAPGDQTWVVAHCPRNDPDDRSAAFHSGPVDMFDDTPANSFVEGEFTTSVITPCQDGWLQWVPEYGGPEYRWPFPGDNA